MAGIIDVGSQSGLTLYFLIRNSSGQVWNGAAFEAYNSANWANYDIAATEQTSSGYYTATFPAAIPAGKYSILAHQQSGGSPALGDPVIGVGSIFWNGTIEEQGIGTVLEAHRLDELVQVTAGVTPPTIGSFFDKIMNKNGGQTFDPTTDSLESLKDTGAGPSAGQIADAVWDEVLDGSHIVGDSAAERLRAIDDKLPAGTISDFDETANKVNLNNDQSLVTVGQVNALGATAKNDVNAEVLDVMAVDPVSELAAGVPPSNPTMRQALILLYMALRNKRTTDTSETQIYNSSGVAICKASNSDNGVIFTKDSFGAP
jgi:hypothetical protein